MTQPASVPAWRKSSYSGQNGSCVEVAPDGDNVLVQDTKDRGPHLRVGKEAWVSFMAAAKAGEFDLS